MSKNNLKKINCQGVEALDKYTSNKEMNMKLAKFLYWEVSDKTLERYRNCGSYLAFVATQSKDYSKLNQANFCQNRFCPMCSWRKALKDSMNIALMTQWIAEQHDKKFIYLTLTTPNVVADDIDSEIRAMNKGFDRLFQYKEVDQVVKGFVRKLEVTVSENWSKSGKLISYNLHIHTFIAVNKTYFTSKTYIKHERWLELWNRAMQRDDIKVVHVQRVKPTKSDQSYIEAVLETAKYTVKGTDLAHSKPVFHALYQGLKGKRLLGYGKLFKEAKQKLENGELDYLRPVDENEYIWKLVQLWDYEIGEYQNPDHWVELTKDEYKKVNKHLKPGGNKNGKSTN